MAITDADVQKIWTWDLRNGPAVGQAYELVVKTTDDVAEIKAAIAALPPPAALTDAQYADYKASSLAALDETLRDVLASKLGDLIVSALVELAPRVRVTIAPPS